MFKQMSHSDSMVFFLCCLLSKKNDSVEMWISYFNATLYQDYHKYYKCFIIRLLIIKFFSFIHS